MKYVTSEIYRKMRKNADPDLGVRKAYANTPEDLGNRRFKFVISTPQKDRSKDIVLQEGWVLEHYKRNPVVLWQHNSDILPIGKAVSIGIEGGVLKATVEFVTGDINPQAEQVYQLIQRGFLTATSVGFIPLEDEPDNDGGLIYHSLDLCEFSIVNAPDNPWALLEPGQRDVEPKETTATPKDALKKGSELNSSDNKAARERCLRQLLLRGKARKGTTL
jgi:HK97 family phage prohead protease